MTTEQILNILNTKVSDGTLTELLREITSFCTNDNKGIVSLNERFNSGLPFSSLGEVNHITIGCAKNIEVCGDPRISILNYWIWSKDQTDNNKVKSGKIEQIFFFDGTDYCCEQTMIEQGGNAPVTYKRTIKLTDLDNTAYVFKTVKSVGAWATV